MSILAMAAATFPRSYSKWKKSSKKEKPKTSKKKASRMCLFSPRPKDPADKTSRWSSTLPRSKRSMSEMEEHVYETPIYGRASSTEDESSKDYESIDEVKKGGDCSCVMPPETPSEDGITECQIDAYTQSLPRNYKIGDSLFVELPRVRLDGGGRAFRRRWGWETSPPPPLLEVEEDDDDISETISLREDGIFRGGQLETSYEKACGERRGSAPPTPVGTRSMESTPSKLVNFFSKRSFKANPLKRTKSVTKLERKRSPLDPDSLPPSRLRTSRSHESLLSSHSVMQTLDLGAGDVSVKPLHSSVLGRDYCFEISGPSGTKYYSCRTAEERDKWIQSLQMTVQPEKEHTRRTENSLKIWILEAKGVSNKKKYFCELCLDRTLFARTCSKQKGDLCFWGEHFEFNNLPSVLSINISLYREGEKKKRREKNTLIGTVSIPVEAVTSRYLIEKWYNITNGKNSSKEQPALRVKCRFQSVEILPLKVYSGLLQYVKHNYRNLCSMLEMSLGVKAKEAIATTLVNIMQREGLAKDFLTELMMMDIEKIDNDHLAFRGNSLATKSMEAYMKLVGERYLQDTLGEVVVDILEGSFDLEVDPLKLPSPAALERNQQALKMFVEQAWSKILNSFIYFPVELRECFFLFREKLKSIQKLHLSDNLISASLFLRFLCPAILYPSLFNLATEYPTEKGSRNLTLVAKVLQTLANFTQFQGKESFMEFLNEFIESQLGSMRQFLRQISSPVTKDARLLEFEGYIDLGKQLSLLHTLLAETTVKMNAKTYEEELEQIQTITDNINRASTQPNNILEPLGDVHVPVASSQTDGVGKPGYQSLQRNGNQRNGNIFRYNDPTSNGMSSESCIIPGSPTSGKASTLPRNTYLMGSGRRAAHDLNTADDYVLFSALQPESNIQYTGEQERRYGNGRNCNVSNSNNPGRPPSYQYLNPQLSGLRGGYSSLNGNAEEYTDLLYADENAEQHSSGELENNIKGSQISISQLSNVASSGYQSFAYSQSSSPVDPSIQQDATNNNNSVHQSHPSPPVAPLAFTNPMYHLKTSPRTPNPPPVDKRSPSSSLSSASVEDLAAPIHSSVRRTRSASSSSDSCMDSPPGDRRRVKFKSAAPRTNPRCIPLQKSPHLGQNREENLSNPDLSLRHRHKPIRHMSADHDWESDSSTEEAPPCSLRHRGSHNMVNGKMDKTVENRPDHNMEEMRSHLEVLEQKLRTAENREASAERAIIDWQERLLEEQKYKDEQMQNLLARLMSVEAELRRDQQMAMTISRQQRVIETQEQKINALDAANSRLLSALAELKNRRLSMKNRTVGSPELIANNESENGNVVIPETGEKDFNSDEFVRDPQRLLADIAEMKSSSC